MIFSVFLDFCRNSRKFFCAGSFLHNLEGNRKGSLNGHTVNDHLRRAGFSPGRPPHLRRDQSGGSGRPSGAAPRSDCVVMYHHAVDKPTFSLFVCPRARGGRLEEPEGIAPRIFSKNPCFFFFSLDFTDELLYNFLINPIWKGYFFHVLPKN